MQRGGAEGGGRRRRSVDADYTDITQKGRINRLLLELNIIYKVDYAFAASSDGLQLSALR